MKIDSHQHFWNYDPERHGWINESMSRLRRDFTPEDLQKIYAANNIDYCVAVQVDQTEEETLFMLSLAEKFPFIKGVVGWLDIRAENLEERLEFYSNFDKLVGLRHIVQEEADVNFMLRDSFMNGISLLKQYNLTYDILVFPHQLGSTLELVESFPEQLFVIDHIAKPYIKDGYLTGWANQMKALAKNENTFCKISGMVTEADWKKWKPEDLYPYMNVVFEAFGSDRLMFGSDWPVCLLAAEYEELVSTFSEYTNDLNDADLFKIWGLNAANFYSLDI
jgi:L-fuconolactonase